VARSGVSVRCSRISGPLSGEKIQWYLATVCKYGTDQRAAPISSLAVGKAIWLEEVRRSQIMLGLADDPALYLRGSEWLRAHRNAAAEEYVLAAFRDDHETDKSCEAPVRNRPSLSYA
jgi:hypothetical protein